MECRKGPPKVDILEAMEIIAAAWASVKSDEIAGVLEAQKKSTSLRMRTLVNVMFKPIQVLLPFFLTGLN